jgi:hypothetical protein
MIASVLCELVIPSMVVKNQGDGERSFVAEFAKVLLGS